MSIDLDASRLQGVVGKNIGNLLPPQAKLSSEEERVVTRVIQGEKLESRVHLRTYFADEANLGGVIALPNATKWVLSEQFTADGKLSVTSLNISDQYPQPRNYATIELQAPTGFDSRVAIAALKRFTEQVEVVSELAPGVLHN